MLNALKIILKAKQYLPDGEEMAPIESLDELAIALDLALRNIKFGDDIQEFLDSDHSEPAKALVEVITGFIDSQVHKPIYTTGIGQQTTDAAPITANAEQTIEPEPFFAKASILDKYANIYYRFADKILSKIGAIKTFRDLHSCGLKDAKDFIEGLSYSSFHQYPDGSLNKDFILLNTINCNLLNELKSCGLDVHYKLVDKF